MIGSRRGRFTATLRTFGAEGIAPTVRDRRPVLGKHITRRCRISCIDVYACPSCNFLEVIDVKVRYMSLEQLDT
jgi:hypothetical protein